MEIKVMPCNPAYVNDMKGHIHHNNVAEVKAMLGDDADSYTILVKSVERSDKAFAVTKDDIAVAIFGIQEGSMLSGRAFPWLICSEEIMDYGITFLKKFKKLINEIKKEYRILDCLIFSENVEVLKMLKWVGFKEAQKETINGYDFYRMVWIRSEE
jgi:hypothetical protein